MQDQSVRRETPSNDVAGLRPSSGALFYHFMVLGLTGFGGVLPIARRMIVERNKWLDEREFVDVLGLSQFLPGGNILNVAVVLGMRFRGARGAAAALIGVLAAPTLIAIALASVYEHYVQIPLVQRAFVGLAAAAAGLLLTLALKVFWTLRRNPVAIAFAAACFCAIAILRAPLILIVIFLTPISVLALRGRAR